MQLHQAFGGVQCGDDVGLSLCDRHAAQANGVKSSLQLVGARMLHGQAAQRDPGAWQAVARVQSQGVGGHWFTPLNQAGQSAVEQALAVGAH